MKAIFLDIDGVLNDHQPQDNGWCGIQPRCVRNLNGLLRAVPDAQLVVSSAWRYVVHNGWSTVQGLEHLLLSHGVDCKDRVHGVTDPDEETFRAEDHQPPFDREYWKARGLQWRSQQIDAYVEAHAITSYVVLDDLPLSDVDLVLTDGKVGLTWRDAQLAASYLGGSLGPEPLETKTLEELSQEIVAWSAATFPHQSPRSKVEHLHREACELLMAPNDPEEAADVFILLAGLCGLSGVNLAEAVHQKMQKNRGRTWGEPDASGVVEHVREGSHA